MKRIAANALQWGLRLTELEGVEVGIKGDGNARVQAPVLTACNQE